MMQFFTSFCAGCILLGALFIICPDGNMSKPIKHTFFLVFLVIIIAASNLPFKAPELSNTAKFDNTQTIAAMQATSAEYIYSYALKNAEINFSKIYVYTDNSDADSIIITKVIIVSNDKKEKIIKALGQLAENREVEIVNE